MTQAIVSVHDVMPHTFPRVRRILKLLDTAEVPPPTLLVVPGKEWTPDHLDSLRGLAEKGYPMAGHGWVHKATSGPRTLFHRGHALLISRNEAEHLSRPPDELARMIRRCHDWFEEVDLPAPELYVPPAWALGQIPLRDLESLPFRWYEVLRGFVEARTGRLRWLPLAGFEADTTFRKVSLRFWNGLNSALARGWKRPLRISIHPHDLDLLLANDVGRMVRRPWRFVREADVMRPFRGNENP
jgi:predicted deacetylase